MKQREFEWSRQRAALQEHLQRLQLDIAKESEILALEKSVLIQRNRLEIAEMQTRHASLTQQLDLEMRGMKVQHDAAVAEIQNQVDSHRLALAGAAYDVTQIVRLNVGGTMFSTSAKTLGKYPDSLLAALLKTHNPCAGSSAADPPSLWLDADPTIFAHVLYFLRTETPAPAAVMGEFIAAAISFYKIPAVPILDSVRFYAPALSFTIRRLADANLSGANLRGFQLRNVDLTGANLHAANLAGIDLSGANLSGANLSEADLDGANLSGSILRDANLHGVTLNSTVNLANADIKGAILRGAKLSGASLSKLDLRNSNLSYTDLSGVDLGGANLVGSDLSGANLAGASLMVAALHSASLIDSNLRGANLHAADLRSANLYGADLSDADLSLADLTDADLRNSKQKGAKFRSAILTGCKFGEY